MNILPSLRRIEMSKSLITLFSVLQISTVFNLIGYSSDAGAITTTIVCNTATSCTTASLNLNAATLRRPDNDALGRAHVGIFIMHPYSGYNNFQGCAELASRGYTTLLGANSWSSSDGCVKQSA